MSGNPPPNPQDVNGFANMFEEGAVPFNFQPDELLNADQILPQVRDRIRQAPYITPASPFRTIREHVLFIIAPLINHPNAPLRNEITRILRHVLITHENPLGNRPSLLMRETIEILRYLRDHPEIPQGIVLPGQPLQIVNRTHIIQLMHALLVRDNRFGLPPNDPLVSRLINTIHRLFYDPQLLPDTRDQIVLLLRSLIPLNIHPLNMQHVYFNDAFLMRLRYISMILTLVLNDPLILQQPNRFVQSRIIQRLTEMVVNPNNVGWFDEHFELLLLMVRLLINPGGLNGAIQGRLQDLLHQLHQDEEGHAFIENFENMLLALMDENAPEPSTDSGMSQQIKEYIHRNQLQRYSHNPDASSQQTGETDLKEIEDTAQSSLKKPRLSGGGKKAKPMAKQAKPMAKQAKPMAKQAKQAKPSKKK